MVYKLKEIPPSRDLENSDLVISGAVSYEEEHVKKPDTETRAGYLRFVDLWADLWGLLQDPIRDDSEGIDGHTGHRNIVLNNRVEAPYALGFILSANYGTNNVYMKISAALRRIYDDDETRTHYESTSIEISSEDTSVDDEYLDVKLSELEQLVVLYKEADV